MACMDKYNFYYNTEYTIKKTEKRSAVRNPLSGKKNNSSYFAMQSSYVWVFKKLNDPMKLQNVS